MEFYTNSILFDSQSGDIINPVDSGQIWYNDQTGHLRVQTNLTASGLIAGPGSGVVQTIAYLSDIMTPSGFVTQTQLVTTSGDILNNVLKQKAGFLSGSVFIGVGSPPNRKGTVTFTHAFADANYSPTVMSTANRSWIVESVTMSGFVINSNSNAALTGNNVYWTATHFGESHSNG